MKRRIDVVALMFGLLLSVGAVVTLLWSSGVSINTDLLKIGAPACLVLVGIIGLACSRR